MTKALHMTQIVISEAAFSHFNHNLAGLKSAITAIIDRPEHLGDGSYETDVEGLPMAFERIGGLVDATIMMRDEESGDQRLNVFKFMHIK